MTPQTALQTVETNGGAIELLADWTPESLQMAIKREKQLRQLIVSYCRDAMNEGHHFYNLGERSKKPALSKEGSLNLCSLFKVTPSPDVVNETFHDDGHYTVRARTHIVGRNGAILATGDGLCTSRESKYAHRWMWASEVPADVNKDELKKKEWKKNDRPFVQYQVPNQDLPDIFNTVLKMAAKRALVDAVLKLPLVSELFTQDLDEQISDSLSKKQEQTVSRTAAGDEGHRETASPVPPPPSTNPAKKNGQHARMIELKNKLIGEHGLELEDLVIQFLPEGVADFEQASEALAVEIIPGLVEILNSRLQK